MKERSLGAYFQSISKSKGRRSSGSRELGGDTAQH